MVRCDDFEVQLVEAESKVPFPEEGIDHQTVICSVIPGCEYFISIRKTSATSYPVKLKIFVDGKSLGYSTHFMSNDMHPEPHYQGLWSRLYGIETKSALKFSFPSSDRVVGQGVSPPVMGHVLVKVYEAAEDGVRMIENHERKPFQAEYVSSKLKDGLATASDDTSKYLRSVEGTTSIQTVSTPTVASVNYRKVRLLCEIKLYYRSS